jgi:hypothetical protein
MTFGFLNPTGVAGRRADGRPAPPGHRPPSPAEPNRSGHRQLNRALHTIAQVRLRDDPLTRADAARRTAEGRTTREIRRCLQRFIARQLLMLLKRYDQPALEILLAA